MSEIAKLLRLDAPADKELAVSSVTVKAVITGEVFTSGLSAGLTRKQLIIFNTVHSASGEVYLGPSGVTKATGFPIEKGKWLTLKMSDDMNFYLVADSASQGIIKVLELA